ncbi:hypothetical protein CFAEC_05690 [Corynebacterium faecale]|uniref:hypothetical protein n=1 Tax=Corynebacterium faecale TaxID=1758466 RepID=UPI0025B2F1CC|nr:hypothetical protein [Corynebacterium faecale]WJY91975.1 hypothetical protein CFAEC_05690 [Corynebacterium faecale]
MKLFNVLFSAGLVSVALFVGPSPAAAAEVQVLNGDCAVNITAADFAELTEFFQQRTDTTETRLAAALKGMDYDIARLVDAFTAQFEENFYNPAELPPETAEIYNRYSMAAAKSGFSQIDAYYLIYLAALEQSFIHWTEAAMPQMLGTHTGPREVAAEQAAALRGVFDFTALHDAIIHDASREIIMPFLDLVDGTLEGFSRPFQACANGQSGNFPIIPSHNSDTTPISSSEE